MFHHWSAIIRRSMNTKDHEFNIELVQLVILCANRFPKDGTLVPKNIEASKIRIVFYDLPFIVIKCIHW